MIGPKKHPLHTHYIDRGLDPSSRIRHRIEPHIRPQHFIQFPFRGPRFTACLGAGGGIVEEMSFVPDTAFDPPGEKRRRAARVGEQDLETGEPVEYPAQVHARERYGRFHREAESQREDVAVVSRGTRAEDVAGEAVVRVQEDEGVGGFEGGVDGVEVWVVHSGAGVEAAGAHYHAFEVGEGAEAVDLGDYGFRVGGEGEGAEGVETALGVCADGVEFVIDFLSPWRAFFWGEEVEPGVC